MPQIRQSNALLLADLLHRQQLDKVVDQIGDVFLKHTSTIFEPFVKYGSHQVISKYIFETEKSTNLAFAKLVEVKPYIYIYIGITTYTYIYIIDN